MSQMKDIRGDIICIDTGHHSVNITFEDSSGLRDEPTFTMGLDAAQTRELIMELKKAIAEVEVM